MALLPEPEQISQLRREAFDASGNLRSADDEIALVVASWRQAESYYGAESTYKQEWSTVRTIYRSPRPFSMYEGSYTLEPNLRRFDVAKWVNSVHSQVMQALFSEPQPFVITPGFHMKQESAEAWGVLINRLLKEAGPGSSQKKALPHLPVSFKDEFGWVAFNWALYGTGAAMYYIQEEEVCIEKRISTKVQLPAGGAGAPATIKVQGAPKIDKTYKLRKRIKFECVDLTAEDCIVLDPETKQGDARRAKWGIRRRMLDFYDLQELALDPNYDIPGAKVDGVTKAEVVDDQLRWEEKDGDEILIAGTLIDLFFGAAETDNQQAVPMAAQIANSLRGVIHTAEGQQNTAQIANPLRKKLEVLEFVDQQNNHVITVLNRKARIRSGKANFGFLSGNYWNQPNALLGLGIGQIGSNNQQLGQWIVNSALKVLAINLNAPHLAPDTIGQSPRVIKIGAGKVLTVTEQAFEKGGMKLLDTAKVDAAIWPVLQESTKEGESATGADALMVQGSSAGPRAGMGRTSGGANIMAGKADTRLDGPMDHLIDQIFLPFIGAIVWFVFHELSDQEIEDILTEEKGAEFVSNLNFDNFHNTELDYDVLIGAKLGALRNLAQSLVLMFEYGMNPQMQEFLADVHGTTIDVQTIYKLLLLASHCGTGVAKEIIRPLTEKELAANKEKKQMAAQMGPGGKLALQDNQAAHDQELEQKKSFGRLTEHIVDRTLEANALPEAISGAPGTAGLQGE